MNIVETLRNSDNKLLKATAADFAKWSKLKHNKECLNLLLQFNIVEIRYQNSAGTYSDGVFTSNSVLINIINKTVEEVKKLKAIKTLSPKAVPIEKDNIVKTYDLKDKTPKTINLKSWDVLNFISITPENVEILHQLLIDILK